MDGKKESLYQCPGRLIDAHVAGALCFYQFTTAGSWPVSGGVLDQSVTFVEAVRIFGAELNRLEAESMEEAKNGR